MNLPAYLSRFAAVFLLMSVGSSLQANSSDASLSAASFSQTASSSAASGHAARKHSSVAFIIAAGGLMMFTIGRRRHY